jgi:hypothetical protein
MALASTGVWEIRSDGSSGNGGYFNSANVSAGTDYSQQAAAQVSVTDGVANGTTTITSATAAFTTAMAGNGIKIGASWYEIVSVTNATTIVIDRTVGAAAGLTMKVGGAVDSPATIVGVRVAGNVAHWKATATYSITATITLSDAGADGAPLTLIGYTTTRGDNGQVTVKWTGAANGIILDLSGALNIVRNVIVDGNGKSADRGLRLNAANCVAINCHGKDCNLTALEAINTGTLLYRCTATTTGTSTGSAGFGLSSGGFCHSCIAYSNAKNGFATANSVGYLVNCIARQNTTNGFYAAGSGGLWIVNCVSYGNTVDGLRLDGSPEDQFLTIFNTVFSQNTGYGINSTSTNYSVAANAQMPLARRWNNAFYSNTLGARNQFPAGNNEITLTADPFTSAAAHDFSLNSTTGGGASLRGTGVPGGIGLFTGAESTGHADVGAVQGLAASSSTTAATLRSLWRELTGEKDTTEVPDTAVDLYLQAGLEALNRRVGYHTTTDTTTIALVDGTEEYTLPSDCVGVIFVEHNGQPLDKSAIEEWRKQGINWRASKRSKPAEWAMYANKLVLYPRPDAQTVVEAAACTLRYVSTPPDFATYGPEQLQSQDWRVAVYYAVAEWGRSYPDGSFAKQRSDDYQAKFESESALIAKNYEDRGVAR